MLRIGVGSTPVVLLTALFTGVVMALQTYTVLVRFNAEGFVASIVALSMVRELSCVIGGLIIAGRSGSAMAAELGTMRVTEQIDALEALATDPIHYLMVPRVWATTITAPLLIVLADAIGIVGGYLVAVVLMGANPVTYVAQDLPVHGLRRPALGADQGRGLRAAPRHHRLPEGLLHPRRRRRRGPRHHPGRGAGVDRHPGRRLLPHQDPVSDRSRANCRPSAPRSSCAGFASRSARRWCSTAAISTVRKGESLVIIGGSGTGKSVLLKHMIGLLRPDSGTVEVDGVDINKLGRQELTRFRRRFGMSFQEGALFDSMNVFENVAFPLRRATDRSARQIEERVEECLRLVHLEGVERKMPSELSGGMRRRVGFARAIALEPEILLFDEPNTGLDPVIKALIDELIVELRQSLGSTTVTITHDMRSAFRIADRIGLLHEGKIVALAPPAEFRELPDPRVQQFIHGLATGPLTEQAARGGRS